MARKDALLKLHQRLMAKRDDLRKKLVEDFSTLEAARTSGNDVGDAANDGAHNELESQLAAFESRELRQVERAIVMIREGRYGKCEGCGCQIPIARLQALPFTPRCVGCAQKEELLGGGDEDFDADWETAFEFEGSMGDREVRLKDLDVDY